MQRNEHVCNPRHGRWAQAAENSGARVNKVPLGNDATRTKEFPKVPRRRTHTHTRIDLRPHWGQRDAAAASDDDDDKDRVCVLLASALAKFILIAATAYH